MRAGACVCAPRIVPSCVHIVFMNMRVCLLIARARRGWYLQGMGRDWVKGRISKLGRFGTFEIEYEDGSKETNVSRMHIQPFPSGAAAAGGSSAGGGGGAGK